MSVMDGFWWQIGRWLGEVAIFSGVLAAFIGGSVLYALIASRRRSGK